MIKEEGSLRLKDEDRTACLETLSFDSALKKLFLNRSDPKSFDELIYKENNNNFGNLLLIKRLY